MHRRGRAEIGREAGGSARAGGNPGAVETRSPATGWPIAAAIAVVAVMLYAVRYALLPFIFALAIAFVLDPLVVFFQRGRRRWPGALLVWVAAMAALGAAFYWIGSAAFAQLMQFLERAPHITHDVIAKVVGPQGLSLFGTTYTPDEIVHQLGRALGQAFGVGAALKIADFGAAATFGSFLLLVLIPYFLVSGPRLAAGVLWLVPPERRHSIEQLLPRIIPSLRRYLVGIFLVLVYTATAAWLGFGLVFRLPHALLLALTVGVLEIIPAVGPLSSAVLVSLAAFEQKSLVATIAVIGFVILLRLTIDNLVGPIVLGQAARLHPVVVIFAFVCGAMLFGVIGLLLAVPTAVCIKVALQHYYAEPIRKGRPG